MDLPGDVSVASAPRVPKTRLIQTKSPHLSTHFGDLLTTWSSRQMTKSKQNKIDQSVPQIKKTNLFFW